MGKKLSENKRALLKEVQSFLWKDWDPIGVKGFKEAALDEYSSFAPQVFQMLNSDKSTLQIALYLYRLVSKDMGLGGGLKTFKYNYKMAKRLKILSSNLL